MCQICSCISFLNSIGTIVLGLCKYQRVLSQYTSFLGFRGLHSCTGKLHIQSKPINQLYEIQSLA